MEQPSQIFPGLLRPSGRADAVIASRILRPKRFVEIKRHVAKPERTKWGPNGVGQIGAGFHDDGDNWYARNVEPKLTISNTKTAIACLNDRIPQHERDFGVGAASLKWPSLRFSYKSPFVRAVRHPSDMQWLHSYLSSNLILRETEAKVTGGIRN